MITTLQRRALGALALLAMFSATGCSTFDSSYVLESDPGISPNAMASADGQFVAAPFSLVAADSIGLATFGQQIVQQDRYWMNDRLTDLH